MDASSINQDISFHLLSPAPLIQVGFHRRFDYRFRALRVKATRRQATASNPLRSIHLISYDAEPPAKMTLVFGTDKATRDRCVPRRMRTPCSEASC